MSDDLWRTFDPAQATTLLQQQLRGRVRGLVVLTRPEGLVLQGTSPTYYGKQLAQHLAHHLFRRPIAANEIEVTTRSTSPEPEGETGGAWGSSPLAERTRDDSA